jgi:hypothetical protein
MSDSLSQRLRRLVLVLIAVVGLVAVTTPALADSDDDRPDHGSTAPGPHVPRPG